MTALWLSGGRMWRTAVMAIGLAVFLLCGPRGGRAEQRWAYLSVFQSGRFVSIDPATGTTLQSVPVQDEAGIAALAWSPAGVRGRLFVLDGGIASRLRAFDPETLSVWQTVAFADRVLRFSDGRLVYPSQDGKWLFVSTYHYPDGPARLRVFDIAAGTFAPEAPALAPCGEPLLASAAEGTIFAMCPGRVIAGKLNSEAKLAPESSLDLPLGSVIAAAASPDGEDLYVLGTGPGQTQWDLVRWHRPDGTVATAAVADLLATSEPALNGSRQAWLAMPQSGRQLVMVAGAQVWLLGRDLRRQGTIALPAPARAAGLGPSGEELLSLHDAGRNGVFALVRTPLAGGKPGEVSTQLRSSNASVSFCIGAAQ
jgi:hypothetical protein